MQNSLDMIAPREITQEANFSFVLGHDTFVSFPTGYGKSVTYALLPLVFDMMRGK